MDAIKDSLRSIVHHLPNAPGVYRFFNEKGEILYVGKAIDLKKRVQSYFRSLKDQSLRIQKLVEKIAEIEYTVVDSDLEALILETNLIKSHRPRYNILMKDDKNYVYVKITVQENFPRIFITRQVEKDGALYFGPKSSSTDVKNTLRWLKKIFPYRHCGLFLEFKGEDSKKTRTGKPGEGGGPFKVIVTNKVIKYPCIDYHIKRCVGPCIGTVNPYDYGKMIDHIIHFFEGKTEMIREEIKEEMKRAAADRQFEKAAQLRDRLLEIDRVNEPQRITTPDSVSRDVIGMTIEEGKVYVAVLKIRNGKLIEQENFIMDALDLKSGGDMDETEALSTFLKQYYETALNRPSEIIIPHALENLKSLEQWITSLGNRKVKILPAKMGEKRKLLDLSEKNAKSYARQSQVKWASKTGTDIEKTLEGLKEALDLPQIPHRIEGYDISHLGGEDTVGSRVVFEGGLAKNADYRHFKLRTVQERIDDYQAMEEVLTRRLRYLVKNPNLRKPKKDELDEIKKILEKEDLDAKNCEVHKTIIIAKKNKIIGIGRLKPIESINSEPLQQLTSVWVDPGHRGEGLAREIIDALLNKQKKGKVYVVACSGLENWYKSLGFNPTENVPENLIATASHTNQITLAPILNSEQQRARGGGSISPQSGEMEGATLAPILVYRIPKIKADPSFLRKPNLILIDGGKGQLGVAVKVLQKLKLNIPVIGLAKEEEWIFKPKQSAPLILSHESPELQLLQRIRNESHRFALKYQKNLRGKRMVA